MSDHGNSLIFEVRKSVQRNVREIRQDMSSMKTDMRSHMASFMTNEVAQDDMTATIVERLVNIEKRLDLREAE